MVEDKIEKEGSMIIQSPTEQEGEEKVTNYDPLKFELARFWKLKVAIIPVVIGMLEMVTERMKLWINKISIDCPELLKKESLYGMVRIIQ